MIRQGLPRRREPDHKLLQRVEWPVTVCRYESFAWLVVEQASHRSRRSVPRQTLF